MCKFKKNLIIKLIYFLQHPFLFRPFFNLENGQVKSKYKNPANTVTNLRYFVVIKK